MKAKEGGHAGGRLAVLLLSKTVSINAGQRFLGQAPSGLSGTPLLAQPFLDSLDDGLRLIGAWETDHERVTVQNLEPHSLPGAEDHLARLDAEPWGNQEPGGADYSVKRGQG